MKRVLLPFVVIATLITIGFLVYQNLTSKEGEVLKGEETSPEKEISMAEKSLENKKIAMVIAFRDFRDIEYFIPRDVLAGAGAKIVTVSSQKGQALGADGGEVNVNLTLEELNPGDFDAVVFIGGPGALKHLDNEKSYEIVRKTIKAGKVLGAICISPVILAKAGVLDGKRATVWSAPLQKESIRILEENKAIYQDKAVVVDGKIVTGNGPGAAREFALSVIRLLTGE